MSKGDKCLGVGTDEDGERARRQERGGRGRGGRNDTTRREARRGDAAHYRASVTFFACRNTDATKMPVLKGMKIKHSSGHCLHDGRQRDPVLWVHCTHCLLSVFAAFRRTSGRAGGRRTNKRSVSVFVRAKEKSRCRRRRRSSDRRRLRRARRSLKR